MWIFNLDPDPDLTTDLDPDPYSIIPDPHPCYLQLHSDVRDRIICTVAIHVLLLNEPIRRRLIISYA